MIRLRQMLSGALLLFGLGASLGAQQSRAQESWSQLRALPEHSKLSIKAGQGKVRCQLVRVTEDAITCEDASYLRPEVDSVRLVRAGASTLHGLLIGLGVGVGGGAIVGAALGNSAFATPGRGAAVGVAIFAPLGAGIGAGLGRAANHASRTVYQR